MLDIIVAVRPYAEIFSFLSGIFVIGGIWLTFSQLKLIKHDIRNRNVRASAEKAIEACDRYFSTYVPLTGVNYTERKEKGLANYGGPIGDFTIASLKESVYADCYARFCLRSWLPALNQLEFISATFISGVADECVGFEIIGRTFCGTVEYNYDVISMGRGEKSHPHWTNLVKLYQLWRPRLSKAEVEAEISEMQKKSKSFRDERIDPIGVVMK